MIVVAGMVPEQGDAAIAGDCDAVNHRMVNYFSWMRADKQRQVFEANREEHSFLKTGRDDWISLIARSDCTTQRIGYCIGLLGGGLMRSESDCRQTCRQRFRLSSRYLRYGYESCRLILGCSKYIE